MLLVCIWAALRCVWQCWAKAFQDLKIILIRTYQSLHSFDLKTLLPKILIYRAIIQKCKKPNPPMGKDWAKVLLLWSNAERVHYSLWEQNRCDSKVKSPCSSEPKV